MFREKNRQRIFTMWYLLNCHDMYTRLKLYELQIGKVSTYQEKESTCALINWIFNANAQPADLIEDDNVLADKAIKIKSEFDAFLEYHYLLENNILIDDVMSFVNYIEYSNLWLKSHHLQYPKALDIVVNFLIGKIDYFTYKEAMIKNHNREFPFQCNLKIMIKTLQYAENDLRLILVKRAIRLSNKKYIS